MKSSQINEIFDKTSFLHGINATYIDGSYNIKYLNPFPYGGKHKAAFAKIPILATGNGLHALNIVMGGESPIPNMYQSESHDNASFHRIFISPGSQLAKILGSGGFVRVNSNHTSSLKEAQKSKKLSACAYGLEDGVLEGVEQTLEQNIIGVQFNPERRSDLPPHFERLFQWLIKVASNS